MTTHILENLPSSEWLAVLPVSTGPSHWVNRSERAITADLKVTVVTDFHGEISLFMFAHRCYSE